MKTLRTFLLVLIFFVSAPVFGQISSFSKVYEDPIGTVQVYAMERTIDSNFVLAGERNGNAMAMKIDTGGNILWLKKIGNYPGDEFYAVANTHDSCFVFAGRTYINGIYQTSCVKINPAGDTIFCKALDLTTNSWALSVEETFDHGLVLCGVKASSTQPYHQIVLAKTDSLGNLLWSRLFSSGPNDFAYSVREAKDSGLLIACTAQGYAGIIKTDSIGLIQWAEQVSYANNSEGIDVLEADSVLYLLSDDQQNGVFLTKMDASGNQIWSHRYSTWGWGYADSGVPKPKLRLTQAGGFEFVFDGDIYSKSIHYITDSSGNLVFSQDFYMKAVDCIEIIPQWFIMAGNGPMFGVKSKADNFKPQIGIVRTDSIGDNSICVSPGFTSDINLLLIIAQIAFTTSNSGVLSTYAPTIIHALITDYYGCVDFYGSIIENPWSEDDIFITPNPCPGIFQIGINDEGQSLENLSVYNITGEKVWQSTHPLTLPETIDISDQADGIYFVRALCNEKVLIQKLVKCQ